MANPRQLRSLIFNSSFGAATVALAIAFLLVAVAPQPAQAQTYSVIHNFSGGEDGGTPEAGVTLDGAGNLYGTASIGGDGYGTAYKLKRSGSNWLLDPLFSFDLSDGGLPRARVIFGRNGTLYGTTAEGGTYGPGTVFNLRPFPTVCKTSICPWMETVLYNFTGGADGAYPGFGDLLLDPAGNIYNTTFAGGNGNGVVYKLTPSGGGYAESVLYSFSGPDGSGPLSGVISDSAGNLYGTTYAGGLSGTGTVYQLMPTGGSGYIETCLNNFRDGNDGGYLYAGLIFDPSGTHLYGATTNGGTGGGGTVFELTPSANCSWTLQTIYSFTGTAGGQCGPWASLFMDTAGNLYGTTYCEGTNNLGNIFELARHNGGWIYTDLHDFGGSDGGNPVSNVSFDSSGNLYGTASTGGSQGVGVAWEITAP